MPRRPMADGALASGRRTIGGAGYLSRPPADYVGERAATYIEPPWPPRRPYAPLQVRTFLRTRPGQLRMSSRPLSGLTTQVGLRVAMSTGEIRPAPVITARVRGFRTSEPWDEQFVIEPAG